MLYYVDFDSGILVFVQSPRLARVFPPRFAGGEDKLKFRL